MSASVDDIPRIPNAQRATDEARSFSPSTNNLPEAAATIEASRPVLRDPKLSKSSCKGRTHPESNRCHCCCKIHEIRRLRAQAICMISHARGPIPRAASMQATFAERASRAEGVATRPSESIDSPKPSITCATSNPCASKVSSAKSTPT